MNTHLLIKKASGETQPFSREKFEQSLSRSGADTETIREIAEEIESWLSEGTTTAQIYGRAFKLLRSKRRSMAARYSLKKAIMELGPSGYPFEQFMGQVFKYKGFNVEVGQEVQGQCVMHEVDVIATDDHNQHLVECKYYNSPGKFANVKVPLYIRSRVNDIIAKRKTLSEFNGLQYHGWVATNTRFTTDALAFGECSGLNLMSWDYPHNNALKDHIERYRIFPITVLTRLTKSEKRILLDADILLCNQLLENPGALAPLKLTDNVNRKVMEELKEICQG
jgi:hypothetical protein